MEASEGRYPLIENTDEYRFLLKGKDRCDRFDYLAAVACGAIGGLIDIFLVGTPGSSMIGSWTDSQVDNAVKGFAKMVGWSPREAQRDNVNSAIGFLEKKFRVNYDQRYTARL